MSSSSSSSPPPPPAPPAAARRRRLPFLLISLATRLSLSSTDMKFRTKSRKAAAADWTWTSVPRISVAGSSSAASSSTLSPGSAASSSPGDSVLSSPSSSPALLLREAARDRFPESIDMTLPPPPLLQLSSTSSSSSSSSSSPTDCLVLRTDPNTSSAIMAYSSSSSASPRSAIANAAAGVSAAAAVLPPSTSEAAAEAICLEGVEKTLRRDGTGVAGSTSSLAWESCVPGTISSAPTTVDAPPGVGSLLLVISVSSSSMIACYGRVIY
mmetsp:Transcript_38835/g.93430  ORF Transcript_38835/g.93430 Transcript_38835/m.93430 type:complete len:269 (+) Transcript_38835:677-1483(+)